MKKKIVVLVILLAAAVVAALWWSTRTEPATTGLEASGTVEATDAQLAFQVPGRITAIAPREGDAVALGAEVASLDDAEAVARRDQAGAMLAAAQARLEELETGSRPEEIAQAKAVLAAAEERLADSERDVERAAMLLAGGAVPRESLDKAKAARDVAAAQRDQAREQLALLERGPRREQIAAARAQVASARATLQAAEVAVGDRRLVAPFAGVVTVRHREPGETVGAGAPVLTLLDRDDRWVRLYVPENRLGAIALGSRAAIRSDTYPGEVVPGEVTFISTEAEFTPKNVQTNEERVRLVYAVKVRVRDDLDYHLKPGMPVDVALDLSPPTAAPRPSTGDAG